MEHKEFTQYHKLPVSEVFQILKTTNQGLSEGEASLRLKQYGPNTIENPATFSYAKIIFEALINPFSLILFAAGGLSLATNHLFDAIIVFFVLAANTTIEVHHQKIAFREISLLEKNIEQYTTVLRDGVFRKIITANLVPGDLVALEEGSLVPADGRIVESNELSINESSLTGESNPVNKNAHKLSENLALLDQTNMAWLGSIVSSGSGRMVVTTTGSKTHFGTLNTELSLVQRGSNPFLERIKKLSKTLGIAGIIIVASIFVMQFGILGAPFKEIILFSLAVLVSIIPESLPTVINITLARGAKNLAENKAVVKELSTIESVGSTSVIVTDKTGTITENAMRVEHVYTKEGLELSVTGFGWKRAGMFMKEGQKFDPNADTTLSTMLDFFLLVNRSQVYEEQEKDVVVGEPTEAALLVLSEKSKRSREELFKNWEVVYRANFLSSHKILVGIIQNKQTNKHILVTIGAPETIWNISDAPETAFSKTESFAENGLRTIACAYREINGRQFSTELLSGLSYLGVVAMRDPIRDGVQEVTKQALEHQIRIIMATGDHLKTAEHIGKEIGIINSKYPHVISGEDFLRADEKERKEILARTNVFARVTPETKLLVAQMLQKNKEIVTMVGDGVNDTLALKQADVGVAMGQAGTDAARAASSMVLADDNFKTIILAIFRGRHIYSNIQKVTNFLLSTNASEALILILATFLGLPLPLVAVQILLINLVTDGIGSLPFAFKEPGHNPLPRPQTKNLITRYDTGIIGTATLGMTVGTLVAFSMFLPEGLAYAQTIAFLTLSLTQVGRLISFDTFHSSFKEIMTNSWLWGCVGVSIIILSLTLGIPGLRNVFYFESLRFFDIVIAFGLSSLPFVTVSLYQWAVRSTQKYYA